jgi:hypothetical protein
MENYMIKTPEIEFNKEDASDYKFLGTFKNVDSGIPKVIVSKIEDTLKNLDSNLKVTPMMVDPETLDIVFGILETNEEGVKLKYHIKITKQK